MLFSLYEFLLSSSDGNHFSYPSYYILPTAVHSKVFVVLQFIFLLNAPIGGRGWVVIVQYLVSFLILQSSRWGRECLLLYFNYLHNVTWLLVFYVSYSWYHGLVCSV